MGWIIWKSDRSQTVTRRVYGWESLWIWFETNSVYRRKCPSRGSRSCWGTSGWTSWRSEECRSTSSSSSGLVTTFWRNLWPQAKCRRIYRCKKSKLRVFCRTCAWSRICEPRCNRSNTGICASTADSRVYDSTCCWANAGLCWSKCHRSRSSSEKTKGP